MSDLVGRFPRELIVADAGEEHGAVEERFARVLLPVTAIGRALEHAPEVLTALLPFPDEVADLLDVREGVDEAVERCAPPDGASVLLALVPAQADATNTPLGTRSKQPTKMVVLVVQHPVTHSQLAVRTSPVEQDLVIDTRFHPCAEIAYSDDVPTLVLGRVVVVAIAERDQLLDAAHAQTPMAGLDVEG